VALTTRPLGRSGSTPHPGPSARPNLLSFRSGRVSCVSALSATLWRLLCKSRLRLLPLNTAPVVRSVVAPAVAALRLSQRDRTSTRSGKPTRDAPGRVSAVTLHVYKTLAAFALQWALWRHVRLHRQSQTAELGECSHFDTSGPRTTDILK
jgi:hypothetical protein